MLARKLTYNYKLIFRSYMVYEINCDDNHPKLT